MRAPPLSEPLVSVLRAGTQTHNMQPKRLVFKIILPQSGCQTICRQNKHNIKRDLLGRSTKCCEAAGETQIREAEQP